MSSIAEAFTKLQHELRKSPTVEAAGINLLVHIRWEIEANAGDERKMRELAHALDEQCAELLDAVIKNTPAEAPTVERAAMIQAEADEADGTQ